MPAVHYQLGCDYFKKEDYGKAVIFFRRAAGLIPGTAAVHNGLGVALAKSKDQTEAEREILLATKLRPNTALYRKNLKCVRKNAVGCALTP
jgi:Flp pilus assembly protein TadD